MKKSIHITAILICSLFAIQTSFAQEQRTESLRDRLAKKQNAQQNPDKGTNVAPMSVRAEMMNAEQTQDLNNATWMREVYRFLDLEKGANAALYNPTRPVGNRMSLFTMMFKLIADNNLDVYGFHDAGNEDFTESNKIGFEDIAVRLEIPFQKNGNSYTYNEFDIPGNEVKGYYIKEIWYFDQKNSVVGVKTAAICPIVFRQEFSDFSETTNIIPERHPQFWVPYENIQSYASRIPILTSDLNNVMNKTIDDYFRLRLYDGEIYKVTNMEDKLLNQQYKTPEALKQAQEKIERELKQFDKNLWVINDSTRLQTDNKNNKPVKVKKSKSKAPKSATYSARDRR